MTSTGVLRSIIAALDSAGIPHMLTGSFASAYHGAGRATVDVDRVIDPTLERLHAFVDGLAPDMYYVSREAADDALHHEGQFNVIDLTSGWKIDLIIRISQKGSSSLQTADVRVLPAVKEVVISATSTNTTPGKTLRLTATPEDPSGNPVPGRTITWLSKNTNVATVSWSPTTSTQTTVAAGGGTGRVDIEATAVDSSDTPRGQSGTIAIAVQVVPVDHISVSWRVRAARRGWQANMRRGCEGLARRKFMASLATDPRTDAVSARQRRVAAVQLGNAERCR